MSFFRRDAPAKTGTSDLFEFPTESLRLDKSQTFWDSSSRKGLFEGYGFENFPCGLGLRPEMHTNSPSELAPFRLSIVVPSYNEHSTVMRVLDDLLSLDIPGKELEVIVVNDGSTDGTDALVESLDDSRLVRIHHTTNLGKGAAVRTGVAAAKGTHVLIFDADYEYDVQDIPRLVTPILSGRAEVVYGNRMSGFGTVHPSLWHAIGNKSMTLLANLLFGSAISDLHTCLKLVPMPLIKSFNLSEGGFGLDTEISAEVLRAGFRPFQVPISYVGRSKEEGKKIRFSDALQCVYVLFKVRSRPVTPYGKRDRALTPRVQTSAS
jgi:glycosyltransferase involved in cell wall biosynthesis